MKRINEIFYSLQGEGYNTGRAAVFVRFAGCNLRCGFCDTDFDDYREMTDDEIVAAIGAYKARFVVLTGGEPTLQADEDFVSLLHRHGYEVAMESNGTRPAPRNLDWLTVSPKGSVRLVPAEGEGRTPDEIKIVFTSPEALAQQIEQLALAQEEGGGSRLYLQPCDTGHAERNAAILQQCVDYIMDHPQWRLSLQTHKLAHFK